MESYFSVCLLNGEGGTCLQELLRKCLVKDVNDNPSESLVNFIAVSGSAQLQNQAMSNL